MTREVSYPLTTHHQFTDTQASIKPHNSWDAPTGGQTSSRTSETTSKGVPTAKDIRPTTDQPRRHYRPSIQTLRHSPLKPSHLTSLPSCPDHKASTQSSRSRTMTAPKRQSSSPA